MNNGSPIEPDGNGVVDLGTVITQHQDISNKVDKVTGYGLSKNDYTDADRAAVATIPSKANDNVVVKSISVNGQNPQTPTEGNVNITVQGVKGDDGITPHIGSNGNWWTGPETDPANDTGVTAQGPAGTSITDADLEIGNALNGQGDVLGMYGAMQMKANIDSLFTSLARLYSKLGNMAFWTAQDKTDAAPTPLDWQVPTKTLTIVNNITNGIVMRNGSQVIAPIKVDMGTTVELLVVGDEGYAIASCAAAGATAVNNGDGTFTVSVTVSDTMTLTITGMATTIKSITLVAEDFAGRTLTDALSISVSQVASGGDLAATIELLDTYFDAVAISSVKDASNNDVTYNYNNGVITIEDVTSDITITATVTKTLKIYIGKSLTSHGSSVTDSSQCYTDYIRLDKIDVAKTIVWAYQHSAITGTSALRANLIIYNSDRKKMYATSKWDSKWVPRSFSSNANNSRTITADNIETFINHAGTKLPLYVRASFTKDGNALASGCGLTQDGVGLFDPSSVDAATEPTIHDVTYTENGAFCNCTRNMSANPPTASALQPNIIDGENFETYVSAESGKTITSVTVTMGGVDITETSWDATKKKITINSVTGALVITTNAS
jgi:hypothetical protein